MAFCPTQFFVPSHNYEPPFSTKSVTEDDDVQSVDSIDILEEDEDKNWTNIFACLRPSAPSVSTHNNNTPTTTKTHPQFVDATAIIAKYNGNDCNNDLSDLAATDSVTAHYNNTDENSPQHQRRVSTFQLPPHILPAPTLEKYYVLSETNNESSSVEEEEIPRNKWSETPVDTFLVRGPNYLEDGLKVFSPSPALLSARGMDLFQIRSTSSSPPWNIGQWPSLLNGTIRKEPSFICNFRFPWGVLVCYFEIPEKFLPFVRYYGTIQQNASSSNSNEEEKLLLETSMADMTPGERTLARFFMDDQDRKNKTFKFIPVVVDGPWAARYAVTGKPVIIGNKLPVQYIYVPHDPINDMAEYLECDLDCAHSSMMARNIVMLCKSCTSVLTLDFAFLVEGTKEDELPEHLMGAMRIYRLDPDHSPMFPVEDDLDEETEEEEFWDCQSTN